jgi:DNA primase
MTDIELIKSKIDIVDYISEHVTLKKAGRHFKGLCPFHSEKTPSFTVSPERQSWHCFGACAEGGDVLSFLQKYENLEFVEALKILADRAGVKLTQYAPTDASRLKEKLYEINHLASEFFKYILTSHSMGKRVMEYLAQREIRKEIIQSFSLGYSPDSWDSLIRFLIKKGYKNEDIYTAGLSVKNQRGGFYDRFRGRLMFTLKDHRGNIVGFSGRKLPPENEKEAKYINTQETPIYIKGNTLYGLDVTREYIKKKNEAVVVEGEFDMLASYQSGVTNVVAIKGSALTEGQIMLLKRYTENVLLALDSDFAGNEAAKRGIEIADNAGLNVKVVKVLYGKDPAECVAKASHLWKESVSKPIPIYDFILDQALTKYDKNDVNSKKKIGSEVIPFIAKITNLIVKSHYIKKIAKELEVNEEAVEGMINNYKKKETIKVEVVKQTEHVNREETTQEHLCSLIIQSENPKEKLGLLKSIITPDDFHVIPVKTIFELLIKYFETKDKFDVKDFSENLTPEIAPTFDLLYMKDLGKLRTEEISDKEMINMAKEIRKFSIRRRMHILSTKIKRNEDEGLDEESVSIQEEMKDLLKNLMSIEKEGQFNVK